jgi:signal transduction histidine kinase
VEEACDAPGALKAASSESFDCILLDYYLPGCDGFDLLRRVRRESPRTPVVMLTGHGDEHTAVELMKAGAADYIAKNGLTGDRLVQSLRYATERQRLENERDALLIREQEARQEAERANRAKDHFLAVLSHDLRTPLTAILGWTRMLRVEKPDEVTIRRGLEIIERNAQAQTRLIEDLVDVSRITSGKFQLAVRSIEPATVCSNALEAVRPAAVEKNIRLEESLDVTVGPIVADPNRLQQVIWNLLTNAIKFTPPGGTVKLELRPCEAGVELSVTDTGRGIRPEFLPRIFEPFSQAAESVQGGLGLGLTIVYSIVELHGGTVHAESDGDGKGARFRVTLPSSASVKRDGRDAEQLSHLSPRLADIPDLKGISVLFIDDNADARELIRMIFVARGATVRAYSTIDEALAALERERPGRGHFRHRDARRGWLRTDSGLTSPRRSRCPHPSDRVDWLRKCRGPYSRSDVGIPTPRPQAGRTRRTRDRGCDARNSTVEKVVGNSLTALGAIAATAVSVDASPINPWVVTCLGTLPERGSAGLPSVDE